MSYQVGKLSATKRNRPSYLYSIISITLVLFMMGVLGCFLVYGNTIVRYLRENIEISLYLKPSAKEADIVQFQKKLDNEKFVKSTRYISKDEAMKVMAKDFHDDVKLLDNNPLPASIALHLNGDYVNQDSLAMVEATLRKSTMVEDVVYVKGLLEVINKNIRSIALVLFTLMLLLFFVSLALIDNTIKLAMYSSRFIIKSMQLVGATRWFIIRPFITKGIVNGLVAGLVAITALTAILYYVQRLTPNLIIMQDQVIFVVIFAVVVLSGIFISFASTYFAVAKYLRMKLDDLY